MSEGGFDRRDVEIRGAYTNVPPPAPGLCAVCTAPTTSPVYARCSPCETAANSGIQVARDMIPLSWAPMPGATGEAARYSGQGYLDLSQYKTVEATPAQSRRLRSLFMLAMSKHQRCILPDWPTRTCAIAHVPSTSGLRTGAHPLEELLLGFFHINIPRVNPQYVGQVGGNRNQRRMLNPENWRINSEELQGASRVLILDDAWVTGGHAQSLAAAFARIGVNSRILVLGRVLDPRRDDHGSYLETHPPALFNSDICPVHRVRHVPN